MIDQIRFHLQSKPRGFHLVTEEILENVSSHFPQKGLLHLFVCHTSCALSINENVDPDVRNDLAHIADRMIRENEPYYTHTYEGSDDMPAHAKSSLFGVDLTIPITNGQLNLGRWQGIYFCEFRDNGGARRIIATIIS